MEGLILLNCVVDEDSWMFFGLKEARGNQSWIFIGKTDAEDETPGIGPPNAKNWLIWKDLDAGKHWRQEEKKITEDYMVGWNHWLNGLEF